MGHDAGITGMDGNCEGLGLKEMSQKLENIATSEAHIVKVVDRLERDLRLLVSCLSTGAACPEKDCQVGDVVFAHTGFESEGDPSRSHSPQASTDIWTKGRFVRQTSTTTSKLVSDTFGYSPTEPECVLDVDSGARVDVVDVVEETPSRAIAQGSTSSRKSVGRTSVSFSPSSTTGGRPSLRTGATWLAAHRERVREIPETGHTSFTRAFPVKTALEMEEIVVTQALSSVSKNSGPEERRMCCQSCRNPASALSVSFRLAGAFLLAFDVTLTPYSLAWNTPNEGFLYVFNWLSVLFWSADLVCSFIIGYHEDGYLVLDFRSIMRRYILTWFAPDLVLVGVDWWNVMSSLTTNDPSKSSSSSSLRILRIVKLGKFLRVLVVLRAMRYLRFVQDWADTYLSNFMHALVSIFKMLFFTIWLTHLMACCWYATGAYIGSDTGERWITKYAEGASLPAQYIYAFQWGMAMVTLGSSDADSTNSAERIMNCLCLVIGLAGSSMLVSSLSAAMVESQLSAAEKIEKVRTLRKYLHENRVNATLVQVIHQQVRSRLREVQRISEKDVLALEYISSTLRSELRFEIMGRQLMTHPLFHFYHSTNIFWCQRFLVNALDLAFLQPLDDIFLPTVPAFGCYCVMLGEVSYSQDPATSCIEVFEESTVGKGAWLSEAALWVDWKHTGQASATTKTELLLVHTEPFLKAVSLQQQILAITKSYSKQWYRAFLAAAPPKSIYPNDLAVPHTAWEEIVFCMDSFWRREISVQAFQEFKSKMGSLRLFLRAYGDLNQEIEKGKSFLVVCSTGEVERIVEVVVMDIRRSRDDRMLFQLGSVTDGEVSARCLRIGGKRRYAEPIENALARLIASRFDFLKDGLDLEQVGYKFERTRSEKSGLVTVYRRTVVSAEFDGELPLTKASPNAPWTRIQSRSSENARGQVPLWASTISVHFCSQPNDGGLNGAYFAWLTEAESSYFMSSTGNKDLLPFLESVGRPGGGMSMSMAVSSYDSLARRSAVIASLNAASNALATSQDRNDDDPENDNSI